MSAQNVWRQAVNLTNAALRVTSDIRLPRDDGDNWARTVTVGLVQANERLDSVATLLGKSFSDSALILARSLFDLLVTLAYISKDIPDRLPVYLRRGGVPQSEEEAEQLREKLEKAKLGDVRDFAPKDSWKPQRAMCCDLGSVWLDEYDTFYRYASVLAHGGSFTLGKRYVELVEQRQPTDAERAEVLLTAVELHLRLAHIASDVFPKEINLEIVKELSAQCGKLFQLLAET